MNLKTKIIIIFFLNMPPMALVAQENRDDGERESGKTILPKESSMSHYAKLNSIICLTILFTTTCIRAGEIHEATAASDLNKVQALIEADPTLLESKDNNGNTPLLKACDIPQVAGGEYRSDGGAEI